MAKKKQKFKLTTKTTIIVAIIVVAFVIFFSTSGQTAQFRAALRTTQFATPSVQTMQGLIDYGVNEIYIDGLATDVSKCGNGQQDGQNFLPGARVCYHVKITAANTQNPIKVVPATLKIFEHKAGAQSCTGTIIDSMTYLGSAGATSTFVGQANLNVMEGTYYWDACISGASSGHSTWYTISRAMVSSSVR